MPKEYLTLYKKCKCLCVQIAYSLAKTKKNNYKRPIY